MSALIFTGGFAKKGWYYSGITGNPGERCAVCETCKGLICKVLR